MGVGGRGGYSVWLGLHANAVTNTQLAHAHIHTRTHAHTHARTHTHICLHTQLHCSHTACSHIRTCIHTQSHAACMHTRAHTHTHTHTRTHTHAHTHTHTHTHTCRTTYNQHLLKDVVTWVAPNFAVNPHNNDRCVSTYFCAIW